MKVLYNWLKEIVDFDYTPEELVGVMESLGIEVEDFKYLADGLKGKVRVARIVKLSDHPNSDHLKIAVLNVGDGEVTVVSGAPGLYEGATVIWGAPGALLPNGMKLEKRVIRGVESNGMPLSEEELGLADRSETVIFLPDGKFEPGDDPLPYLGLDDYLYDIHITPNRGDLLGMIGLAYDIKAKSGGEMHIPEFHVDEEPEIGTYRVDIENLEACPRYVARIVRDVKVQASPDWLRYRLALIGQRPINNIVDVTNYVLFLTGHPIHAFDLDKLEGDRIVVRFARKGEKLLCLDGVERELDPQILVIADERKPVAIAGVIGGEETGVTEETRNILIESAMFDQATIRRAVTALKVTTESSYRFERKADINAAPLASLYAASMVKELAGGRVGPANDVHGELPKPVTITLRQSYLDRLLGHHIEPKTVVSILEGLGFQVEDESGDGKKLSVTVPSRRRDISIEADLVEEVARIYGYDNIPSRLESPGSLVGKWERSPFEAVLDAMLMAGFIESKTIEFISPEDAKYFVESEDDLVRIINPVNDLYSIVRPSLIPSLLQATSINLRRGNREVRLFERGKKFKWRGPNELPEETEVLSVVVAGTKEGSWIEKERQLDFYDLKVALQAIEEHFRIRLETEPHDIKFMYPGGVVVYNGKQIGIIGEIKKDVLKHFDIKVPVFALEIELTELPMPMRKYTQIPKFPPVKRDISILVDRDVHYGEIEKAIEELRPEYLSDFRVVDLYEGKPLPKGKKSITISLSFQHPEKTLRDTEVDAMFDRLVRGLIDRGFIIRGINDEGVK